MRGPEELDSSFPLGNKTHFNFFIKKETHMIQNPRESKGKPCGASRLPGANTVSVLWCALPHAHCHRHTHTHAAFLRAIRVTPLRLRVPQFHGGVAAESVSAPSSSHAVPSC